VIDLRGGLVVPGAPGLCAVDGDDRALIAGEDHTVSIFGIDPELMIVITAGRALDGDPCLAGVEGHVGGCVDVVCAVGVRGVDGDLAEVPATAPEALLTVDEMPGGAGVVGEIDAAGGFSRVSSRATTTDGTSNAGAEVVYNCVKTI
jgi:hypothetical protein